MYRLLIVEDEHLIRKWLRYAIDYLKRQPFSVQFL